MTTKDTVKEQDIQTRNIMTEFLAFSKKYELERGRLSFKDKTGTNIEMVIKDETVFVYREICEWRSL